MLCVCSRSDPPFEHLAKRAVAKLVAKVNPPACELKLILCQGLELEVGRRVRGGAAATVEDSEDNDGDDEHSATSGSADDDGHRVRCRGGAGRVWRGGVDNARALVLVVDCVCIAALWGEDALPRAADERRGPAVGARHLPNQRACVVLCRSTKSGERGVERERESVCVCALWRRRGIREERVHKHKHQNVCTTRSKVE